ncbi:MAG: indole-3-glycerol phosphate synthase TrpC [Deltaproteobacteria bacterium]|nr:indole-3-glycerol phosphate synthase TrpC [Deltaproteobacteria bacterium]
MVSFLDKILKQKEKEVERLKTQGIPEKVEVVPRRDFKKSISVPERLTIIAEVKFASPSAGVIRRREDSVSIARQYQAAGAAAVSVVTEGRFFGGNIDDIKALKACISIPVLRKDFILDRLQVMESFIHGADAVLLIAKILDKVKLKELISTSRGLGMEPLVEVHDRHDLDKALETGAQIIGINNRNLSTFQVDLGITGKLAPLVPQGRTVVSESGIYEAKEISELGRLGVNAALVGSALMGSRDLFKKTRELVEAGERLRLGRKGLE